MTPADAWQPIETMPMHKQVLVSDGDLVKPAIRVGKDTVSAPILMTIGMWSHWRPFPAPPLVDDDAE